MYLFSDSISFGVLQLELCTNSYVDNYWIDENPNSKFLSVCCLCRLPPFVEASVRGSSIQHWLRRRAKGVGRGCISLITSFLRPFGRAATQVNQTLHRLAARRLGTTHNTYFGQAAPANRWLHTIAQQHDSLLRSR